MASLATKPTVSSPASPVSSTHTLSGDAVLSKQAVATPSGAGAATPTKHASKAPKQAPAGFGGVTAPLEVSRFRFWMIFLALMLSVFLFALDQLIVATAIPSITEQFNSLTELPWIASGFFLTLLGFNLIYSQWLQIFPSKHVVAFAIFIFEVGSLVCGVAPSMEVLILGRAIAGVGAAGIFSGAFIIVAEITPMHNRAQYFALIGVCFAIASVLGPLVGGAFSDHITWRWCFYINLPFGGVALGLLLLATPTSPPLGRAATYKGYNKEMLWKVLKCDWLGSAISMAWATCVILALQWGGVTKSWNDGSVIACLVMIPVLPIVFLVYEWYIGEHAMFKMKLLKRRTMAGASIVLFCGFAAFMLVVYYLSEGYQAVYHTSATGAGVRLLPLIMVQIVVLMASARLIPKIGRYKWVIVAGPFFIAVASGLLYSVNVDTSEAHLYGYQALFGIGIGLFLQNSMVAMQFELKSEPWLISAGTGLGTFLGFAGRIVGISLAGSVFENMIQVNLHKYAPDLPTPYFLAVINSAQAVWTTVPEQNRPEVLTAYVDTLRDVYIIGVPFAIFGLIGALIIKNSKMQTKEQEEAAIKAAKEKRDVEAGAGAGAAAGATGESTTVNTEKTVMDAESDSNEAAIAEGIASVGPIPEGAVEGGMDAQAVLASEKQTQV